MIYSDLINKIPYPNSRWSFFISPQNLRFVSLQRPETKFIENSDWTLLESISNDTYDILFPNISLTLIHVFFAQFSGKNPKHRNIYKWCNAALWIFFRTRWPSLGDCQALWIFPAFIIKVKANHMLHVWHSWMMAGLCFYQLNISLYGRYYGDIILQHWKRDTTCRCAINSLPL